MPIGERPSPPPCGWLAGSIATPRTPGRIPNQRDRPAFPSVIESCSRLLTWPIVAQQRQARGPVRIVFYRRHFCRHTIFVALEIHDAVVPLVSSTPMAYSDSTLRVAAAGLSHRFDQGSLGLLFGDLIKRRNCCKALSRRDRLELFQSHVHQPP